eukprot:TRINITY_DN2935_c2_g1_i2.p1 TRINITY_DN2935_c2_g1~~TRINITY_DN2935_c2_g1_i2.p1  ORF type:complete len:821 (-),score=160.14 TRINITY_DN2935_c2_g1_i2:60-2522(-)
MPRQAAGSVTVAQQQEHGLDAVILSPNKLAGFPDASASPVPEQVKDSSALAPRSPEIVPAEGDCRSPGLMLSAFAPMSPVPAPQPTFTWPCDGRGQAIAAAVAVSGDGQGAGSQRQSGVSPLSMLSPCEGCESADEVDICDPLAGTGADAFLAAVAAANAAVEAVAGRTPTAASCPRSGRGSLTKSASTALEDNFGLQALAEAGCSHCSGVPYREVERWCGEVARSLESIYESVDAKMEIWRAKMAEKDQVIKRLYCQLKQQQGTGGSTASTSTRLAGSVSGASLGSTSHLGSANRSPLRGASGRAQPVRGSIPGSPGSTFRNLPGGHGAESIVSAFTVVASTSRAGRAGSLSPPRAAWADATTVNGGRSFGAGGSGEDQHRAPRARRNTVEPGGLSSSGAQGLLSGLSTPGGVPSGQGGAAAAAAVVGSSSGAAQSPTAGNQALSAKKANRPKEAAEKVQLLYLRQEIAQLRRQNAELQGQVRTRDSTVDQLSGMMREMQVEQQRRLGGAGSSSTFSRRSPPASHRGNVSSADCSVEGIEEIQRSRTFSTSGSGGAAASSSSVVVLGVVSSSNNAGSAASTTAATAGGPPGDGGANRPGTVVSGSRRLPSEAPTASAVIVASSRVGATAQAPRVGRRVPEGNAIERSGSLTRSSSAFSRQKEQMAARRVIVAAAGQASGPGVGGGQMSRMFSPRSIRQPGGQSLGGAGSRSLAHSSVSFGSASAVAAAAAAAAATTAAAAGGGGGGAGCSTAASIAQAAQAAAHAAALVGAQVESQQALGNAGASSPTGVATANRSASVDARTRTRLTATTGRRSLRRP